MKQFALLLFALLSIPMVSQNCCTSFADLGEDQNFRATHEIPQSIDDYVTIGEIFTFPTPSGPDGRAYLVRAQLPTNKYLVVIHEWWGMNTYIKREADRFATELPNVNVIAVDLYDGKVANDRETASKYMQAAKEDRLYSILEGVRAFAGPEAELATIGWCFGGGWSLKASIHFGPQAVACVMYYGMPVMDKQTLAKLDCDVLAIFAEKDGWITPKVAADFAAVMRELDKNLISLSFDADHAFANPSSPRYQAEAAQKANERALQFLLERLN